MVIDWLNLTSFIDFSCSLIYFFKKIFEVLALLRALYNVQKNMIIYYFLTFH